MAPAAKQVLQVVTHDVSGVHAWMGMVDGMKAADPAPPHMALIKRFFFGPQKLGTIGVVHCVEGEENLKAVNELFALDGPFLKGFFESPVMKGKEASMQWNSFEVAVQHPATEDFSAGVSEGDIVGVYGHGVPDAAQWAELFQGALTADDNKMHKEAGIVKSFGGPLAASPGKNAWATDAPATVMVVHVFKSLDDKAKFDQMFDPTAPFFADLIAKGAAMEPFFSLPIGPVKVMAGTAANEE